MGKIFACSQIAEIDAYTIANEPIADIDLMERASDKIADWLLQNQPHRLSFKYIVFAGPGNNGGDALAVSRFLCYAGFEVKTFILDFGKGLKGSPLVNYNRLRDQGKAEIHFLTDEMELPETNDDTLVVDGLFGSGLNRKLEGLAAKVVKYINKQTAKVISIDIPSGLFGEDNSRNDVDAIVKADQTLTFQFPKLSFLFPEYECFIGKWEVLDIGLSKEKISSTETNWYYTGKEDLKIKSRNQFSHKGTFGHALLIAGSYGKMGAAVLASKACLRAGAGLVTCHTPRLCYQIIHNTVPEAMVSIDQSDILFTDFPALDRYTAVGIGPALDVHTNTQKALHNLISQCNLPLVLDADALNILSQNKDWFDELPRNSVLTPHPKEFERLVGPTHDSFHRLKVLSDFAVKYHIYVVLKGAHTVIACPDAKLLFNSTGNPGMATAGSGDVLTGMITSLLSQEYSAEEAAVTGVYIHGLAGDIALSEESEESLIAGDLISFLGKAFKFISKQSND